MKTICRKCIICTLLLGVPAMLLAEVSILELSLADCRELVLRQNLEIAMQKMGRDSAEALYRGERLSVWEPSLVVGADRESNQRENTTEQFISQGVENFEETNNIYRLALEQPLPTGGQVELGYNLRDLKNNLREQRELEGPAREYEGFLGVVFTQPLLRNAGRDASLASVRIARAESEVAFQEWRRQIMQSLGAAEAAFWELEIAQRRVELREASVTVAEKILEDNRARREAGRGADVEIQQAEAGLAIRRTQVLEARQNLIEASNRLTTFFSESLRERNLLLRATEAPKLEETKLDLDTLYDTALELHPDILIRQYRLQQDNIRMEYTENQKLPDVNLTASYGYNGLEESASDAFAETTDGDYVSWSVGVELRIPLGGDQRARGEYEAARSRARQATTGLKATEIALTNSLTSNARRVDNHLAQARNYQEVATLNSRLLETELARLDAGQSDSRKVLDTEERLTEALEAEAASLTRYKIADLELELAAGTLLSNRNLDPMLAEESE